MKNKIYSTKDSTQKALTRRDFMKVSLATTGALTLPILIGCQPADLPPITLSPKDNFPQPKTISSVNRVLQTTLLIKFQPPPYMPLGTKLRMYGSPKNGTTADPGDDTQWDWSFPAPTLRVNPGDRIKLTLLNYLPMLSKEEIGVCEPAYYPTPGPTPSTTPAVGTPTLTPTPAFNNDQFPDCFSENNVTNLHYHGMHVKQGERGDDVLLAIYPHGQDPDEAKHGEEYGMKVIIGEHKYDFEVPKDHPQGTFWYHPHKHGATDLQVANGMAGTIIVSDTLNDDPVFKDRPPVEQVLVIQQILPDLVFPLGGEREATVQTVNGVTNPVINMQAGEVQRWRIINATGKAASAFQMSLSGDGAPEMFLIAVDGNFLDEKHWKSDTPTRALFLAPGNRADVLVAASKEGQFDIRVKSTTDNQKNRDKDATPTPVPQAKFTTLLTVNVAGTLDPPMQLPANLPPLPYNLRPFAQDEKDTWTRMLTFERLAGKQAGAGSGNAPMWAINGQQFNPQRVDQCMVLGTSETWTLLNTTTVAHPFHIHLNPFLIEQFIDPTPNDPDNPITTGDNPEGQWQDTIIIPAAATTQDGNLQPGKVVIRHRFVDFTGKFVLHCHILGHEDRGMMQLLEVVKNASECTSGGGHAGP